MNCPEPGAVARGHVLVHRLYSVAAGHLAVLLVHVVGAGAGVVADPNTKVLHLRWALLLDLPHISTQPDSPFSIAPNPFIPC